MNSKVEIKHLRYIGQDSWQRYVYVDECGTIWKLIDCCSPRAVCEERGDRPYSAVNNSFDGEPDCPLATNIIIDYTDTPLSLKSYVSEDGTYLIPVAWSVYSTVKVEADNLQDAVNKANKLLPFLPTSSDAAYIDDSYHICADCDEDYIDAQSYKHISDITIDKNGNITYKS